MGFQVGLPRNPHVNDFSFKVNVIASILITSGRITLHLGLPMIKRIDPLSDYK
jgi:hypothetical protein